MSVFNSVIASRRLSSGVALMIAMLFVAACGSSNPTAKDMGTKSSIKGSAATLVQAPEVQTAENASQTIRISTYDGPAEVTSRDGSVIGKTPYPLSGRIGERHEIWLRRTGFKPRKIEVQIIHNNNELLFGLEKLEAEPDSGNKE